MIQKANIINTLLKSGIILLLLMYSAEPSIANEPFIESELSLEESLAIDKEMDTLFGPRRYRVSYRDYTALQKEPAQPPIWPLYKQQPALAQGDFRNASTDLLPSFTQRSPSSSSPQPATPSSSSPQPATPSSSSPQPSTPINNNTPNNQLPSAQDSEYREDPGTGTYETVPDSPSSSPPPLSNPSMPQVELPGGAVPTLPSTLPPWVIFPPPSEGGGVVL